MWKGTIFLVFLFLLTNSFLLAADPGLRGTLVVAVPVSDGLVVCADKRLYNNDSGTFTDNNIKLRKVSDTALFAATNTVGFYDEKAKTMAFNAFDVTSTYASRNDLNSGKRFWDGLKKEITARLKDYFAGRPYAEWPESDRQNNNLLFNLIFYSVRDGKAWSHSLKVFYEKARTPVIFISDPIREQVRTPKLAGKGREVMNYLARDRQLAANPLIQRFDETRFDLKTSTADDAVEFARTLFRATSDRVPQANVSQTFDCAMISYENSFRWLSNSPAFPQAARQSPTSQAGVLKLPATVWARAR